MSNRINVHEIAFAGLFIALGVIVPQAFHLFGMIGGQIFLPMHLPVLIGSAILSPGVALMLGVLTPLLSSALTGMPVLYPMGVIMMFELGTYAFITALLHSKFNFNSYINLILAMVAGRIVAGLVVAVLFIGFGFQTTPITFVVGAIVTGISGIIIQIIVVPPLQIALKKIDYPSKS